MIAGAAITHYMGSVLIDQAAIKQLRSGSSTTKIFELEKYKELATRAAVLKDKYLHTIGEAREAAPGSGIRDSHIFSDGESSSTVGGIRKDSDTAIEESRDLVLGMAQDTDSKNLVRDDDKNVFFMHILIIYLCVMLFIVHFSLLLLLLLFRLCSVNRFAGRYYSAVPISCSFSISYMAD